MKEDNNFCLNPIASSKLRTFIVILNAVKNSEHLQIIHWILRLRLRMTDMGNWNILLVNCLFPILLLTSFSILPAQQVKKSDPIELKYADSLIGKTLPTGFVREVIGHCKFVQGNVTVTCDHAIEYPEQNYVELLGNVVLVQETVRFSAPIGTYNGNTHLAFGKNGIKLTDRDMKLTALSGTYSTETRVSDFFKQVTVENDSLLMYCDTLHYERETENSFAHGRVFTMSKFSNSVMRGDSLTTISGSHYSRMTGGFPMLCNVDTSKKATDSLEKTDSLIKNSAKIKLDTLCISADTLEAFRIPDNEKYIAKNKVKITRGSMSARCGYAIFYKNRDTIRLLREPIVWMDSTQLSADSITIGIYQNKLRSLAAYSNALAATKNDSTDVERVDQLTGENIFLKVSDDTVRLIRSVNKAYSLYFLKSDSLNDGAARNAADTISIYFDKGKPDNIYWLGGVEGEYFPEHLVNGKLKDFRLKNFRWYFDRPRLKMFDFPARTK